MNPKEAKKILPKNEFEAFEKVFIGHTRQTSAARLKQLIGLAKKLRTKYRSLARDQGANVQGRGTFEIDTSLNDRKANLFDEMIEHLEDELLKPRPEGISKAAYKKKSGAEKSPARGEGRRLTREARLRTKT